ncbi:MAG TPA: aminotransferase class I/II-fold pyridoxal phosphate-dependent enzyme [Acidobacteriota bacterium]|nr:aminotransferase class I/II-fold pyridoxal phosphate-dependent enzyme [Acidobacteriota bacterium]
MSRKSSSRSSQQRYHPDVSLNLNVRGLGQSATLAINQRSAELRRQGRHIYKLGLGQSPFPVPDVVVEALRKHAPEKDYLPPSGLMELRQAVADYHSRQQGIEVRGEDALIGPGSKELMFILQLVYYGDLVIPSPSWVSYAPQARIIGRRIHWLPTELGDDWGVQPEVIEKLFREDPERPRLVILNYPGNPSGGSYPIERLKALADLARKYRVILLSDEIYGELNHRGQHVSIARFYPEGTIISAGLSKWCGAGGWRLGTFTFPPSLSWLREAMAAVASETYTSTSTPIQYAAVRAFKGGDEIDLFLAKSRRILGALGRSFAQQLRQAEVRVPEPRGGFYLFPDFGALREQLAGRGIATSKELAERLLEETGVAALPGSDFGRPQEELTLRLAYVDFDGAAALKALPDDRPARETEFLQTYCANTCAAAQAIVDWLNT